MRKTLRHNGYSARRVAYCGLFLALALIVTLLENMLPPIIPALPYAKIGFGNIVLLACFLLLGTKEGYIVLLLRCLFSAIFAGNFSAIIWSLPSALVAYTVMVLMSKSRFFGIIGISTLGGILHNLTQLLVASAIVGNGVFAYLPYMMLAGGLAGVVTGIVCYFAVKLLNGRMKLAPEDVEYVRELDIEEA